MKITESDFYIWKHDWFGDVLITTKTKKKPGYKPTVLDEIKISGK